MRKISSRYWVLLIFIFIILFYIGWDSKIYNFDGTVYALQLRVAATDYRIYPLYSPYHMLFLPIAWSFFKIFMALNIDISTISFLQMFNTILGVATLLLFYKFCIKRFKKYSAAIFASIILAVSYVFWYMAHESETYMITLFFMVLTILFLFDYKPEKFTPMKSLILGFLFGLSVLGHITAILMIFPIGYYIFKKHKIGIREIASFMSSTITIIAIPYIIYFLKSPYNTAETYKLWLLQALSYKDIFNVDVNFWSFSIGSVYQTILSTFNGIVTTFNYGKVNPTLLVTLRIICGALILAATFILIKNWKQRGNNESFLARWSLWWLLPLTIFYTFWGVEHFKFRILVLPPIVFLLTIGLFTGKTKKSLNLNRSIAFLLITFILITNIFVSFIPAYYEENNPDLIKAFWINQNTPFNSVIVILGLENYGYEYGKVYIPYFSDRRPLILNWFILKAENGVLAARNIIERLRITGNVIFVLSEVVDDRKGRELLLEKHPEIDEKDLENLFDSYELVLWKKMDPSFSIYLLRKP